MGKYYSNPINRRLLMSKQASISKRVFRQFIGYIKRVYHFGSVVKGM